MIDAPVTIEDAHSRVLAYSAGSATVVPEQAEESSWSMLRAQLAGDAGNRDSGDAVAPLVAAGSAVSLEELSTSRAGADEVLGLLRGGRLEHRVAVYEEVWHLLVLRRMAGPAMDARVAELGPLPALRAHDSARGTEYVATLLAWLRHPGDPRAACAELRVHPNTFRYRMRRVTAQLDVDLDDRNVRAALLAQLLAAEWAGSS